MGTSLDHTNASSAVIEAVADREGVDQTYLAGPPLYESIDVDALDTICQFAPILVSFKFHGYIITVDSENNVEVIDAP